MSIFITGTDTEIGKTLTSCRLIQKLQAEGKQAGYFKPVQTGTDSDTDTVTRHTQLTTEFIIPPVYYFPEPMAPHRAAEIHGAHIDLAEIKAVWDARREAQPDVYWVIEGAGGLLVPLTATETIRDLILLLQVPVLLVSSSRLGTINHTLLTVESIRNSKIPFEGVVWTGEEDPEVASYLLKRDGIQIREIQL